MATVNYVRFIRGTPTAFKNLSKKDPDTLYFIAEKNSDNGVLYLGEKLISGGGKEELNLQLSDFKEILLDNNIDPDSILIYDGEKERWVNKPFAEVFNELIRVMTGATETKDGDSGYVPAPKAGQQNMFLRGDGTWVDVTAVLDEDYSQLKQTVSTLVADDTDQSVRQIAVQVLKEQLIPDNATLDSLEKISSWIQSHSNDKTANNLEDRIQTLEDSVYGVVDGGQIVIKGLTTRVGDLNTSFNQLDKKVDQLNVSVDAHTDMIDDLYDRLKWQNIELSSF